MRTGWDRYSSGQSIWHTDYYLCKNIYHLH